MYKEINSSNSLGSASDRKLHRLLLGYILVLDKSDMHYLLNSGRNVLREVSFSFINFM